MEIRIFSSPETAVRPLARKIASIIRRRADEGRHVVLGLATGRTPLPLYAELIRLHREEGLSFANVVTFNLDEYEGLGRDHPQSYWRFMHDRLFDQIDIPAGNIHLPDGNAASADAECAAYENAIREAGGIDFQILGIGRTGHIGFNEPGSGADSRTRRISLDPLTREDAAKDFGGIESVPTHALTMGCGTILAAREIALLGWGRGKAEILRRSLLGPITGEVPATFLQNHRSVAAYLDQAAASALPRSLAEKERFKDESHDDPADRAAYFPTTQTQEKHRESI